jgi:tetratricopeptide (TPR) repeat protein
MFYIENKQEEALNFIQSKKLDVVNNHLFTYMAANLALNSKRTDYAKQVIENRTQSSAYLGTPVWDFELGYAYLHKLELDKAIEHLERFFSSFKGKFYVKDVLQKLSWAYYLKGNKTEAEKYRRLCLKTGNTDTLTEMMTLFICIKKR